jgi:MFS family permease
MLGQARNIWQYAAAYAVSAFMFGISVSLINVLTGLFAPEKERGKIFGLLGLTMGLGAMVGGLSVGPLVDRWGFPTMYSVLAVFTAILPLCAIFLDDKKIVRTPSTSTPDLREKPSYGRAFVILTLAHLIVLIVNGTGNIGRSLAMEDLEFTATAISSTGVIGGVVQLPFPFIVGWLSDRVGRKRMMIICYAAYVVCMVLFAVSKSLWQFWIAMALFGFGFISNSVGNAFVTDLVEPKALGRGISLFQSMNWIGNVIGLAVTGFAIQNLGVSSSMLIAAILPLIGIVLIISIRVAKPSTAVNPGV